MLQMLWQGDQCSWMMSKHSVPSLYTCGTARQAGKQQPRAQGRRQSRTGSGGAGQASRQPRAMHFSELHALHPVLPLGRVRSLTLGWNTSLVNRTRGGLSGYCSLKVTRSSKIPPCAGHRDAAWSARWARHALRLC